ncbi:tRNA(Arg) A34 adenosine deaminase TadA [Haloferula luteola]|uniref:tRNA(Arg) A34 adenosine deaminase TadA n=1 Tax=Haloferula luteola TaxID=595692 RepID=A0A840VAM5_9BACT|nr:nucleoside deaminase [Haloferula luteola]MBB5350849.1 tRNA(Arg) A34 adenosine deaminase TadA [Haloferula luteola]
MEPQEKFMRRAIELARQGMHSGAGGPFGAVIVRDGQIVGEGWNQVVALHDPTAHGEVTAIRDACSRLGDFRLTGCDLYTTGQPCPMCLGAIHWARISRIYYGFRIEDAATIGFDDREFFEEFARPEAARKIPAADLIRAEALQLIEEYRHLPQRTPY